MTLQELLADAQVADDMEVAFGDKKFKVADLRAYDKERQTRAAADDAKVKAALAEATKKQKELTDLATEAAAIIEKAKASSDDNKGKDGDIDFDTDPLYAPLMKGILKPLQSKMAEYDNAIKTVNNAMAQSATFIMHDYYDRRWRDIPEAKRPKDKTWKDYLKIAAEKKVFNEFGMPDPVKAFNEEIQPVEMNTLAEENKKLLAQIEELKKAPPAGPRMPRTGTTGTGMVKDKTEKVFDSVDALVDEAFADPMIQEIANSAGRA